MFTHAQEMMQAIGGIGIDCTKNIGNTPRGSPHTRGKRSMVYAKAATIHGQMGWLHVDWLAGPQYYGRNVEAATMR